MATELSANNPDLIESIRRNIGNRPQPDSGNPSNTGGDVDQNKQPPPPPSPSS